jgi:hypothetical protein
MVSDDVEIPDRDHGPTGSNGAENVSDMPRFAQYNKKNDF